MQHPSDLPSQGRKIFVVLLIILSIVLITCENESPVVREYPRLSGTVVSNVTTEGATFSADLYSLGSEEIIQSGFLWSNANNEIDFSERVFLGVPSETGVFSVKISTALLQGAKYFVKPFVQTKKRLIYGPVVTFMSLGSKGPVIAGFSPDSAAWGDTITIYGRNFSWLGNKVFLNNTECSMIKGNDTVISATVEPLVNSHENTLSVEIAGSRTTFEQKKFRLIPPRLTDFYPKQAYWGDTIYLRGNHLKYISMSQNNSIFLGSIRCPVLFDAVKDTLIKIVVHNDLAAITNPVKINIGGFTIFGNEPFVLKQPVFTYSPAEGTWRSLITIKGRFHPVSSRNVIKIGGYDVPISTFSKDSVKIMVPTNLQYNKNQIVWSSTPFNVSPADSFTLSRPIVYSVSPLTGRSRTIVTVKGKYLNNGSASFTNLLLADFSVPLRTAMDSIITFEIPYNAPAGLFRVALMAGKQKALTDSYMTITNPVIYDFNPKTATFNEDITIKGKNFIYGAPSGTSVSIGWYTATLVSVSDSLIIAKVPDRIDSIPQKINVQVNGASAVAAQNMTLKPPVISGTSPETVVTSGTDVLINGTGFHPFTTSNFAFWGVYRLIVKSATPTQLTVTLPSVMSRSNDNISVNVGGYIRKWPMVNEIKSKWESKALPGNVSLTNYQWIGESGISFSLENKAYFIDNRGNTYTYDPSTDVFSSRGISNLRDRKGLVCISAGGTAYLMDNTLGLHKFDPVSNTWTKIASSPISGNNQYGAFFYLDNKIYYGLTYLDYYGTLSTTLWSFNSDSNTWTQRQSLPATSAMMAVTSISMNNKGYVLLSDNSFFEYDPSLNTWTRLLNYPGIPANYAFGRSMFEMNGKIYAGLGRQYIYPTNALSDDLYNYDRSTNSWTLASKIPFAKRYNAYSLVINNKAYFISGFSYGTSDAYICKDMLIFDPEYPLY